MNIKYQKTKPEKNEQFLPRNKTTFSMLLSRTVTVMDYGQRYPSVLRLANFWTHLLGLLQPRKSLRSGHLHRTWVTVELSL